MLENKLVQLGLAFIAGLVVAWNFLAQPQFLKDIFDAFTRQG